MLEVNVTVKAPELAEAILSLAAALSGAALPAPAPVQAQTPPGGPGKARHTTPCAHAYRSTHRRTRARTAARRAACGTCGRCSGLQPRADHDRGRRAH